jgi:LPPG:FO 2-phospho-L-lactate transferase
VRSQALRRGETLSAVTAALTRAAGLETRLLPATDDRLRTQLVTPAGTFPFQEWFVARGHEDEVDGLIYDGADAARPAAGVIEAIEDADAIVIAPSNPFVSIHPILAVPGIRAAIEARRVRCVAVSPLIGGRAVRGPLDRMMQHLLGGTTPALVAGCYADLLNALVIDRADATAEADGAVVVTDTLMSDRDAARRLAQTTLEVAVETSS